MTVQALELSSVISHLHLESGVDFFQVSARRFFLLLQFKSILCNRHSLRCAPAAWPN